MRDFNILRMDSLDITDYELTLLKGVYAMKNKHTGRIYVGHTAQSYRDRWTSHLSDLRRGKHHNAGMQSEHTCDDDWIFVALKIDGSLLDERNFIKNIATYN